MSRKEKLLERFLSNPVDFTFDELTKLLNFLGYVEIKTGKTSGSRVAFYNEEKEHIIRLHKPHPGNILKKYQMDYLTSELDSKGLNNERYN